jgi:hypothetical protein
MALNEVFVECEKLQHPIHARSPNAERLGYCLTAACHEVTLRDGGGLNKRHRFRGEEFLPLDQKKALPSRHLATHFCLAPNQLPQSRQREE